MLTISVFPQETELLNIGKINTETTTRNSSNTFNLALEGNSDLNLCYGDLEGRIAWIPPGISGGVPYNGLEEINNAISNGNISSETPYVDPNSTGNYYLGPFIHLDNNNCDGEYDGTETLMENITSLAAGCYIVYVIDALGMQSEITSITISEPTEIMTLIPLINNTCNEETNGSIEIQINGGTPFDVGSEYVYVWSGPNNFVANTQNITQLESGTYNLLVKDANDCSQNFEFNIEELSCGMSQTIDLQEGWSIISTYINPNNNSVESIFNPVINNLEIVKDEDGNVYWPLFGLNSIGSFTIGEGYQVKMNSFSQIIIEGDLIPHDTPITFNEGWNLIGYLHPEPGNTIQMMNSIVLNDGPLKIIKNGAGNVYWPEFGLNSIGNMMPGEGYQTKLENLTQFSYPAISSRYGFEFNEINHYYEPVTKTDQNMVIGIPENAWEEKLHIGDEIAAFDTKGKLIGTAVYNNLNLAITIWGDDILTEEKDGAIEGEKIQLKVWNSNKNTEQNLVISWKKGNQFYTKNAINIARNISFNESESSENIISTHDILGRVIKENTPNQIIFQIYKNGEVRKKYFFK